MRKKRFGKKPHKQRSTLKKIVFLLFVLFVAAITIFLLAFDKRLLPVVVEMSEIVATTKINKVMEQSIRHAIENNDLHSYDFFEKSVDENGRIQTLSVNSLLIDEICAGIALDISQALSKEEGELIKVPIGVMLGIQSLANFGPQYSIKILPMGNAVVDYASRFESAGINQINFQIWLNIDAKLRIVNPLQNTETSVSRKVLLVNTIFAGEVPSVYLNNNSGSNIGDFQNEQYFDN